MKMPNGFIGLNDKIGNPQIDKASINKRLNNGSKQPNQWISYNLMDISHLIVTHMTQPKKLHAAQATTIVIYNDGDQEEEDQDAVDNVDDTDDGNTMNDLLEKDAILARGYVDIIRYLCPLFLNPYDTTKRGMQSYNVHGSMTQTADASPEPHKTSSNPNRKITTERESSNACINKRKMNKLGKRSSG